MPLVPQESEENGGFFRGREETELKLVSLCDPLFVHLRKSNDTMDERQISANTVLFA